MLSNDDLIEILTIKIRAAEEYAQDIGDEIECDIQLAKASAYREIIDLIISHKITLVFGF